MTLEPLLPDPVSGVSSSSKREDNAPFCFLLSLPSLQEGPDGRWEWVGLRLVWILLKRTLRIYLHLLFN